MSGSGEGHGQHRDQQCVVACPTGQQRMIYGHMGGIVTKLSKIERLVRLGNPIRVFDQNHEQARMLGHFPVSEARGFTEETIV